jgi:hypothetical protein
MYICAVIFSMKKIILVLLVALVLGLNNSCKTDFSTIAPYKEMVCVYGLIEHQNNINYIRINRVFLTDGNAYDAALNSDSVNFKAGELTVSLDKYRNGAYVTSFALTDTTIIALPGGDFATDQRLWVCYNQLANFASAPDKGSEISFILKIHNNKTNKDFTGTANMVGQAGVSFTWGSLSNTSVDFTSLAYTVKWGVLNPQYGSLDNMTVRFYYQEFPNVNDTLNYTDKYVDWNLGNQEASDINSTIETIKYQFYGEEFYKALTNLIPDNPNIWARKARYLDVMFTSCGDEFNLYSDVNTPSNTIVQDKPLYTNISDGVGVFSSRTKFTKRLNLLSKSIDKLAGTGSYQFNTPSCNLKFLNSDLNPTKGPGCQ